MKVPSFIGNLFPLGLLLSGIAISLGVLASLSMPKHVTVDGRRLRMSIQGTGSPTVILETFGVGYLETWNRIQPEIAKFARVVSYDHASYWGSDPGPKPRDAKRIAEELRAALREAKIPPPYILAGYSFGGPYVRVFANMYSDDVSGMVLVDPTQESFMRRLRSEFPEINVVAKEDRQKEDEWGMQRESMEQAEKARLPDVPMILITGAKTHDLLSRRLIPLLRQAHAEWLSQYPRARHIVTTNSGHGVVFTEPRLIVDAVRELCATPGK